MSTKLIDRVNDVSMFASTDETRYTLNGVFMDGDGTVATDGRGLLKAPYPDVEVDQFPNPTTDSLDSGIILSVKDIKLAHATLPKVPLFPAFACIHVGSARGSVVLETTDGNGKTAAVTTKPLEGQYPSYRGAIPTDSPAQWVAVNPIFLEKIAKYAKQVGAERVDIGITNDEPIQFTVQSEDGRISRGMFMPLKHDGPLGFISHSMFRIPQTTDNEGGEQ